MRGDRLEVLAVGGRARSLLGNSTLLVKRCVLGVLLPLVCVSLPLQAQTYSQQHKELVATRYRQEVGKFNWYYRAALLATARSTQAAVLKGCMHEDGSFCDDEQLHQVLQQEIGAVTNIAGAIATYSMALSFIVLSAYAGSKFNELLASRKSITDAQRDFVRVFIPILTGFGVFSVGAPLWDPLKSFVRRWAFASNQRSGKEDAFAGKHPNRPVLEAYWQQIQKYFSINAQISRNTLSAFLMLVTSSLQDARRAYDEQRFDYAAAQYAKVMVQMRFLYSELTPGNPILAATIHSYLRGVAPPQEFLDDILSITTELDPLKDKLGGHDYYVRCIRAWFDADYEPDLPLH